MAGSTKNVVLSAAAAVILLLAVVLYFARGSGKADLPTQFKFHGVCLETKQEMEVAYSAGERPPMVNPDTGRRTVYAWWYCGKCNKRFVPNLIPSRDGGPPRVPGIPSCSLCGNSRVGVWNPDDPEQANPAGDAPPPKLPG